MNDPNPYSAPDAVVADLSGGDDLAGRGERLGAAILDTLLLLVVLVPLMVFGGYWQTAMAGGGQVPFATTLLWGAVGFIVFAVIQGVPLQASGQTWGKKVLGIRIVDLDGGKPPLGRLLGLRYLPVHAVGQVPVVGALVGLVNVLLIFREDRRCGHDLIAGTRVVKNR